MGPTDFNTVDTNTYWTCPDLECSLHAPRPLLLIYVTEVSDFEFLSEDFDKALSSLNTFQKS